MAQNTGKKFQNDYVKLGELLDKRGEKTLNESIAEEGLNPSGSIFAAQASNSSFTPTNTTTNTTINNNMPELNIGSSLDSLSTGDWFLNPEENNTGYTPDELAKKAREQQDKEERWILSRVRDFIKWVPSWADKMIKSQIADTEYQANEKQIAMWYDEDSWDVLYLDLNEDRWLFDWTWWKTRDGTQAQFDRYQQDFLDKINAPWASQDEINQAWLDFYNWTKNLFRLRADDLYSDWFLFNAVDWDWKVVGRRKNLYSQEQLDNLAANGLKKWDYIPTFDEWLDYVQLWVENQKIRSDIYSSKWITGDEDEDVIDLSPEAFGNWKAWYQNVAFAWIVDLLDDQIWSINANARNEAMLSIYSVVDDQANRIWQRVQPVYAAEQVVLAKPESERTEWEKELLEIAWLFRKMERAAAMWLNDWATQEIKYWTNSKWEITESLEVFDWNKTLSDVLTSEVKRLSWRDWNPRDSVLDVFGEMANDALYAYHRGKGWWGTKAWRRTQHWLEWVWNWLWEEWQQIARRVWELNSLVYYAATPLFGGWWTLRDKLSADSREGLAPTSTYLDQDFTWGRLIETDDWNIKRTIKKYLLQTAEYAPEAIGNIAPDIAIWLATEWVWFVWALRNIPKVRTVLKDAKWLSALWKLRASQTALRWMRWFEGLSKWWNTAIELADRALTQGIIDQAMDAQRSAFDTEAYSWLSQSLSILGTFGMNILPELVKGDVLSKSWVKKFASLFNGSTSSWSIWDLAEYIDSSPQAAENIAQALHKNINDIWLDDLRVYAKNFSEISAAAEQAYKLLPLEWKEAANRWTKQLMYNYINQTFGSNSEVAKTVRLILNNGSTNPADIIKYLGKIPWDVSFWPYVSNIKFKHWTTADVVTKGKGYDVKLDSLAWWFDSKIVNWFTQADIDEISKLTWYSDVAQNKNKLFDYVWDRYYLKEDALSRFGLKAENSTLATLWITLKDAENTRELFREKMKDLTWKKISDDTIDKIADSGAYDEIVQKIKEVMC